MPSKLIFAFDVDGEHHRFEICKCDIRHVHVCNKNGRLCDMPKDAPEHCKMVGKKLENCVIERVVT